MPRSPFRPATVALAWCCLSAAAAADVALPAFITSGMVVQRDVPILLRGTAAPRTRVRVSHGDAAALVIADEAGRWSVTLPKRPAGPIPDIVMTGPNTVVLTDLLAGDVWLAAGQSNMEFTLRRAAEAATDIPLAARSDIRLFKTGRQIGAEPCNDVSGTWRRCTPDTAAEFSAVAYYFARDVHAALRVPVGVICAAWGGTPAEAWVASGITRHDPDYAPLYAGWEAYRRDYPAIKARHDADMRAYERKLAAARESGSRLPARPLSTPHPDANHKYPGVLFDGMIHPFTGLPLKGFLWYQGESNKDRSGQYRKLLESLVIDWRSRWNQGDLPFLIVSLANFKARAVEPADSERARVREAQAQVARHVPACALAVTIDLGEADDIHPRDKAPVGRRLALAALERVYGRDVVGSGPLHRRVTFRDGAAVVEFDATGGGLVCGGDGTGDALEGFAVAGADRRWHWAAGRIEGDRVIVTSPRVAQPVAVRYAWADNPPASLYNKAGLPAVPFRTDDWPLDAPEADAETSPD